MNNKELAKQLRRNMTPQECKFWELVRAHRFYNLLFRRQHPIGDYIVDFICRSKSLIVELDGGQHNLPEDKLYDERRTAYLESKGYKVLRFWNNEIDNNFEGVYLRLKSELGVKD